MYSVRTILYCYKGQRMRSSAETSALGVGPLGPLVRMNPGSPHRDWLLTALILETCRMPVLRIVRLQSKLCSRNPTNLGSTP